MKLKTLIGMIILGGAIFLNTFELKQTKSNQTLTLESVINEAWASSEGCLTTPGANTGTCRMNIGGGYSCVTAGFWDSKDCSGS